MRAQSSSLGPLEPSAQLSRCQPWSGTSAASSSARLLPAAVEITASQDTAMTYGIPCSSSHVRSPGLPP